LQVEVLESTEATARIAETQQDAKRAGVREMQKPTSRPALNI
jgi:hypothetical protein